jgi:hypothetical protein
MADLVTRLLLNSENFDNNIRKSTKQIQDFKARANATTRGVTQVLNNVGGAGLGNAFASFASGGLAIAGIGAATTALVGLTNIIKSSIESAEEFQTSLSHLSSLTGLTGKNLDYLKDKAIEFSESSTVSAKDIVDAYTKIGSMQPVLLKDKEGLAEVTKETITLSEASGMDMTTSAKALTMALNQYGVSAGHAAEYINILAAAAQQGSGNIPYLATAIEKSGGAASAVGVKFNELVAAIEAIAPKMTEPEEAGTSLRNVFLQLEKSTDKNLRPSVVGFTQALQNFADKGYSAVDMMSLFGKRNVTAALALVKAKNECLNFSNSIEGTSTAEQMAATNIDNFKGSVEKLKNEWADFLLKINSSDGELKIIMDDFGYLLNLINNFHLPDLGWFGTLISYLYKATIYLNPVTFAIKKIGDGLDYIHSAFESDKNMNSKFGAMLTQKTATMKAKGEFNNKGVNYVYRQLIFEYQKQPELIKSIKEWYENSIRSINEDAKAKLNPISDTDLLGKKKKSKKDHKTLIQQYDDELKKLDEKRGLMIEAHLSTNDIDKKIEAIRNKKYKLELAMDNGSELADLEKRKSVLQEMQKYSKNNKEFEEYQKQIDEIGTKAANIQGTIYLHIEKGSLADMQQKLSDIQQEIENTPDWEKKINLTVDEENLKDNIKNAEQLLNPIAKPVRKDIKINDEFDLTNNKGTDKNSVDIAKDKYENEKEYLQKMYDYNKEAGSNYKYTNDQIEKEVSLVNQLKNTYLQAALADRVKEDQEQVYNSITGSISSIEGLASAWESVGSSMEHGFRGVLQVIDAIMSTIDNVKSLNKSYQEMISLLTDLGMIKSKQALLEKEDAIRNSKNAVVKAVQKGGDQVDASGSTEKMIEETTQLGKVKQTEAAIDRAVTGQKVANAATSTSAGTVATNTEIANDRKEFNANVSTAASGAAKSTSWIPIVGTVLAAAGIALMLAKLNGLKFANGGIVPGASYSGDNVLARLNSGEMVLNTGQQSNLWKMVNSGVINGGNNQVINTTVTHVLKGSELKLLINNEIRRTGGKLIGLK